jgi:hypothetical protein
MSDDSPIRVFVAHLFEKSADYLRVFEYLETRGQFNYLNTADPDARPPGGREAQKEELRRQIAAAEVVVLPVTAYDANRELATFQLDAARALHKPVIAIRSFGETVVLQKEVMNRAADIVEWNERVLIDAIRQHARHEQTSRWETIEFKLD